jgi:hypothetical protein
MEMNHYKDADGKVYGFAADGSQHHFMPAGLIEITTDKIESLVRIQIDNEFNSLTYAQKRAAEYPPMTDYLDGVVKGDQAQIQTYIDACLAVKAKYPKS